MIKNFIDHLKAQELKQTLYIDYGIKDVYIIEMARAAENENEKTMVTAVQQLRTIFKNDSRFKEEQKEVIKGPSGDDFLYVYHMLFK